MALIPFKSNFSKHGMTVALTVVLVLFSLPIFAIIATSFGGEASNWLHFAKHLLPLYLWETSLLIVGVVLVSGTLGLTLAWGCYRTPTPVRNKLVWLLTLPICFPGYLLAYLYTDILQVGGVVYLFFSEHLFVTPQQWPEIRSLWGGIAVFSLSLYPYVFLPAFATLMHTSPSLWDAASTLGYNPRQRFFKVTMPLIFPSLLSGTSLVAMEVLNDFGTTQYFSINTIATGVFRAWTGLGSIETASQVALVGLVCALVLTKVFFWAQRRKVSFEKPIPQQPNVVKKTSVYFIGLVSIVFIVGFFVPIAFLFDRSSFFGVSTHLSSLSNTVIVMAIGAFCAASSGLLALYFSMKSVRQASAFRALVQVGYAIPGTIVALGVLIVTNVLQTGSYSTWTVIALFGMCYGYCIRFSIVPFQIIEGALLKLPTNLSDAARVLGLSPHKVWWKVTLPAIKKSALVSLALLAIDIAKDLSVAIVLRPFNFDTLPIKVYLAASDERLSDAAMPAIFLVGLGAVSLYLMMESFLNEST